MPHPLVDRPTLDDLGAVIGRDKLDSLIGRFVASLDTALAGDARASDDFAREAHTLISMSGMLGCEAFSQACRGLEQVAKAGGDLTTPLAEARSLRDRTVAALREIGTDSAR